MGDRGAAVDISHAAMSLSAVQIKATHYLKPQGDIRSHPILCGRDGEQFLCACKRRTLLSSMSRSDLPLIAMLGIRLDHTRSASDLAYALLRKDQMLATTSFRALAADAPAKNAPPPQATSRAEQCHLPATITAKAGRRHRVGEDVCGLGNVRKFCSKVLTCALVLNS
jgi:hypothetical protein